MNFEVKGKSFDLPLKSISIGLNIKLDKNAKAIEETNKVYQKRIELHTQKIKKEYESKKRKESFQDFINNASLRKDDYTINLLESLAKLEKKIRELLLEKFAILVEDYEKNLEILDYISTIDDFYELLNKIEMKIFDIQEKGKKEKKQ